VCIKESKYKYFGLFLVLKKLKKTDNRKCGEVKHLSNLNKY